MLLTEGGYYPIFGVDIVVCICIIGYYISYRIRRESKDNFNEFIVNGVGSVVVLQAILIVTILFL